MILIGGQFKRVIFFPCPAELAEDKAVDAFVSGLLALPAVGPLPPGLEVGAPIKGRDNKGDPVVRIPFYGVQYTVHYEDESASMSRLYYLWISRFVDIASQPSAGTTIDCIRSNHA